MTQEILLLGASTNPERYSNMAIKRIRQKGWNLVAVGRKDGTVDDVTIVKEIPDQNFDTVTIYLSDKNQEEYEDKLLAMKPGRVIFNPGAENPDFEKKLKNEGVEVMEACTLVLISTGQF